MGGCNRRTGHGDGFTKLLRVAQLAGQFGLRADNQRMQPAQAIACLREKRPQLRSAGLAVAAGVAVADQNEEASSELGVGAGGVRGQDAQAGLAHAARIQPVFGEARHGKAHRLRTRMVVAELHAQRGQSAAQQWQGVFGVGEAGIGAADGGLDRRAVRVAGREAAAEIGRGHAQQTADRDVRVGPKQWIGGGEQIVGKEGRDRLGAGLRLLGGFARTLGAQV